MKGLVYIGGSALLLFLARQIAGMGVSGVQQLLERPEPGVVAPERGSDPASAGAQEVLASAASRVVDYTMTAVLNVDEHLVEGRGVISWRNTSRVAKSELYVHLYLNAFRDDKSLFMRMPASGFRGNEPVSSRGNIEVRRFCVRQWAAEVWPAVPSPTPDDSDDQTDIRLELPRSVEPGETIDIEAEWVSTLPSLAFRTGFIDRFQMVAQWFPKIARLEEDGTFAHFPFGRYSEFYSDFGRYDVTVDAPQGFVIAASADEVGSTVEHGRVQRRFVQDNVHDFAFAAWDRFTQVRKASREGVEIVGFFPPGYERAAAIELVAVDRGLTFLGRTLGKYPYKRLTVVHPPAAAAEAGGMEYPTLISTGGSEWSTFSPSRDIEIVTVHELAHQWFYGLLATNENRYPFLDEGLTSYAEVHMLEAWHPNGSLFSLWPMNVSLIPVYRFIAQQALHSGPIVKGANEFESGQAYAGNVYSRAATLLLTLGNVFGRERLWGAIGDYARRYRFAHPTPEDLLLAVKEGVGESAAEALRAGLFDKGWVDFELSPSEAPGRGFEVRRRGPIVLPVEVDVIHTNGARERLVWDGVGESFSIAVEDGGSAVVDPERKVLLDENFLNQAGSVARSGAPMAALAPALFGAGVALWAARP